MDALDLSKAEWISAISTGIIALFTVVIAILTGFLAFENWRSRRGGILPYVIAYIRPSDRYFDMLVISLANVGSGPAFDVTYRMHLASENATFDNIKAPRELSAPLNIIPQNNEVKFLFGSSLEICVSDDWPRFELVATYTNIFGIKRVTTSVLDLNAFKGFCGDAQAPEIDIANRIKELERTLSRGIERQSQ